MPRQVLVFAASYFASVFAIAFALGVVRTLWLAPAIGPLLAVATELPIVLAVSWWVATRLHQRWPLSAGEAALAGGLAFALLFGTEAALSQLLAGRDLAAFVMSQWTPEGALGLAGQSLFAAMPWWTARKQKHQENIN